MENTTFLLFYFIIGATIGALLGNKRRMGLVKGLLMGLFLNWLGWIIIVVSDKKEGSIETSSSIKRRKILFIVLGGLLLAFALVFLIALLTVPVPSGRERTPIMGIILFGSLGISVLRKGLSIKNIEQESAIGKSEDLKPSFVLESNMQRRIDSGGSHSSTALALRTIKVYSNDGDHYSVEILDSENHTAIMDGVSMHKVSYSEIDECLSMVSDDTKGEYTLNVFYKDGQINKCVVYRKSKDIYIHYFNE